MKIQYLEVVTPDVEAVCQRYALLDEVQFGEPEPMLGGAHIAALADGGWLGVRPPLRESEQPVVRHYLLVEDIQAAVDAAAKAGAEVAVAPMVLPGFGTCAIIIHGGVESGFWQL
ncbi:hypothetical protein [Ferrimonas senticii]|uniref:hypothetical protein n=1 Tax=Ferrimonas senticii TaxID=394566 RepID=UPI000406B039|nr:hypothetical protein [Ferrimonas senticii]